MIRFVSDEAEQIYQGRWGGLVGPVGVNLLEECFMDLRLVEVARLETDFLNAFVGRISWGDVEDGACTFVVGSPSRCKPGSYEIRFVWQGGLVVSLDLTLCPSKE